MKTDCSVRPAIVGRVEKKKPLYIRNFINEEKQGSMTLYVQKQDIKFGFQIWSAAYSEFIRPGLNGTEVVSAGPSVHMFHLLN
jgi:hypothetical protein